MSVAIGISDLDGAVLLDPAATVRAWPHLSPIVLAAATHRLGFYIVPPGGAAIPDPPPGAAWIFIIRDDQPVSVGPTFFPDTNKLFHAATRVVVASGDPDPQIYRAAATDALSGRRILIVETMLKHHATWARKARKQAWNAAVSDSFGCLAGGR